MVKLSNANLGDLLDIKKKGYALMIKSPDFYEKTNCINWGLGTFSDISTQEIVCVYEIDPYSLDKPKTKFHIVEQEFDKDFGFT